MGIVRLSIAAGLVLAALPVVCVYGQAQSASASATAAPASEALEEITVVAQKRSENVMRVPISITALSGDMMEKAGVTSTDDLQTVTPGIEFPRQVTSLTPFIRGVGSQTAPVGVESAVAIYVDGVYQSLPVANSMEFNNLEHIEVLKGPQGTLFGRNATGGAVNIITKDPSHEFSGETQMGYGNFGSTSADAYVTTGVLDSLAVDFAMQYLNQSKGYVYNVLNGQSYGNERSLSLRNKWMWTPSDLTTVKLSLSDYKSTGGPGAQRNLWPGAKDIAGNSSLPGYYTSQSDYIVGVNTGNSWFNGKDAAVQSRAATLHVDQEIPSWFKLVSITGYLNQESFYEVDQDVGPDPIIGVPLSHFNEQFSQEFQFLSNTSGPLTWLGGLYYLKADHRYDPLNLTGEAFYPLQQIDIHDRVRTISRAVFAQATYAVTPADKITIGGRYTNDHKQLTGTTDFVAAPGVGTIAPFDTGKRWEKPTWSVVLDHEFNLDWMAYASYTRGFQAGSYNAVVTSGVPDKPANPETIDAYEIGAKGQTEDRRASLTTAIFFYRFSDMQVSQEIVGGESLTNAANSKIEGAELNIDTIPIEHLTVRLGAAYTFAQFIHFPDGPDSVPNPAGGNEIFKADLSGNTLTRAPRWTGTVAGDYDYPTAVGKFDTNLTLYLNSGFFWEVDNRLRQPSYHLLSARERWTASPGNYGVELWGKNLTDTKYAVFAVSEATDDSYSPAPPRTYGFNVFYKF